MTFCLFISLYHIIYISIQRDIIVIFMDIDSLFLLKTFGINYVKWLLTVGMFLPISLPFITEFINFI